MKVAWFSHHRENSGWADASIKSILALDSVGVEVVPINVSLTGANADVPPRIEELEKGSAQDADYCVQNILPHHMVATSQYKKNVGFFVSETSTLSHTPWISPLSAMDELWVPNCTNYGFVSSDIPSMAGHIHVIPYAFDQVDYEGIYDTLDLGSANSHYKFYYIGDLNDRKNLRATIRCYQSAFLGNPNVSLLLKVGGFGRSGDDIIEVVQSMSTQVKQELKLFSRLDDYCNEIIIPNKIHRKTLLDLHNTCDCYVSTSHGEGWGIPIYEAFCLGNPVIAGNWGGPADFLINDKDMLVNGTLGPCTHKDSAFPFLGTGRELWFNIDESEVMQKMLKHYNEKKSYRKEGLDVASEFSYDSIGTIMKDRLQA
jgi:glycosyltransferase involved in cell wall biosynthesis